jgi:putative toxin-antitoxin system antitoxin component (TIGR02293 family)
MNPSDVVEVLGGSSLIRGKHSTSLDLVDLGEKGLTKASLSRLAEYLRLTSAQMARLLPVTARTLQRYTKKRPLSPVVSGHMLEIAGVAVRGVEVFGEKDVFLTWMSRPSVALGNRKPLDLLSSPLGIDLVLDELGRIEHGVFS